MLEEEWFIRLLFEYLDYRRDAYNLTRLSKYIQTLAYRYKKVEISGIPRGIKWQNFVGSTLLPTHLYLNPHLHYKFHILKVDLHTYQNLSHLECHVLYITTPVARDVRLNNHRVKADLIDLQLSDPQTRPLPFEKVWLRNTHHQLDLSNQPIIKELCIKGGDRAWAFRLSKRPPNLQRLILQHLWIAGLPADPDLSIAMVGCALMDVTGVTAKRLSLERCNFNSFSGSCESMEILGCVIHEETWLPATDYLYIGRVVGYHKLRALSPIRHLKCDIPSQQEGWPLFEKVTDQITCPPNMSILAMIPWKFEICEKTHIKVVIKRLK
jgi:hypothetical protein